MKKHTSHKKTSNRLPPSVPKCVRRATSGYATDFIKIDNPRHNYKSVHFFFTKENGKYTVLAQFVSVGNNTEWINLAKNINIAPATRNAFSNLTTLSAAITAVETWLDIKLPDIR